MAKKSKKTPRAPTSSPPPAGRPARRASTTTVVLVLAAAVVALSLWLALRPHATATQEVAPAATPEAERAVASEALPPIVEAGNLLANPGFEQGEVGWHWLEWSKGWAPFRISRNLAYEGDASVLLPLRSQNDARSTIVWGAVQEVELTEALPGCIEGYYYVDKWSRGAERQYLQLVIIDLSRDVGQGNAQLRYVVSGAETQPHQIGNAHYIFLESPRQREPVRGQWVPFATNPAQDFQTHWGYVPGPGHKLRILYEARFDLRGPGSAEVFADVYYDNLYLGPPSASRCRR